ncbi:unnamed protein product [Arabidopsis thaliana]|uniref:RING-type E3 ubiquitin transferase n=1 Tax=Arabidopsis thaliana TaxID=3702 RepID=A0A5S9WPZ6_ARATH|nr:unnamed protein product [Arabidopsis thaliana]
MENITNNSERSLDRPKRQRPVSMENVGGTASGSEVARSATLLELDLLDCPICYHKLGAPIYQCDNGHIACSSCCKKVKYKCPYCSLRIGFFRSRILEKIVEAVVVSCPNAKYGCTEKIPYDNESESAHERVCEFTLCYCPEPECKYTGVYTDLYRHYHAEHKTDHSWFKCGEYNNAWLHFTGEKLSFLVLQEYEDGPLVVVQCSMESHGICVTVNCIAPCAPGVGEFSCHLIYRNGSEKITFESKKMNKIQKVSPENHVANYKPIPYYLRGEASNFMSIPYYLLDEASILKMQICIRRSGEEV